jgi:HKD family nuclease
MDFEKAKQIRNELSHFLPCHKHAFVAPEEQNMLQSFFELAMEYRQAHRLFISLLNDNSIIDKIQEENFSDADFDIYVVSRYYNGKTNPQAFKEYLRMEEIDFDISKFD